MILVGKPRSTKLKCRIWNTTPLGPWKLAVTWLQAIWLRGYIIDSSDSSVVPKFYTSIIPININLLNKLVVVSWELKKSCCPRQLAQEWPWRYARKIAGDFILYPGNSEETVFLRRFPEASALLKRFIFIEGLTKGDAPMLSFFSNEWAMIELSLNSSTILWLIHNQMVKRCFQWWESSITGAGDLMGRTEDCGWAETAWLGRCHFQGWLGWVGSGPTLAHVVIIGSIDRKSVV